MSDKIRFLALGGLNGIGNNLYCVEVNDDIFVFSVGCGFPDRYTPGVDFVISNFSYLSQNKERIKGYFIPSATNEEFGALPYVYKECPAPIYCTSFTNMLLNIITTQRGLEIKYDIREIDLPANIKIDGRELVFFRTCSNEPDSYGLAIKTDLGNIIFSGSFIVEYSINPKFALDVSTLSKLGEEKTLLYLMDSKNAQRKGFTSPKHRVYDIANKAISESKNKTYIGIYSTNVYNFLELLFAALNNNKFVCLYDTETEMLFQSLIFGNLAVIPFKNIIKANVLHKYKASNVVVLMVGEGPELYRKIGSLTEEDEVEPAMYITPDDTFVLAAPAAPNFEVLSIAVLDELYRKDCTVVEILRKEFAYMHPSEDDIKVVTAMLNPEYCVPIKGNYQDLVACRDAFLSMHDGANKEKIFVLDVGDSLSIDSSGPKVTEAEDGQTGIILVDGAGVGDVANDIINERNLLAADGVVCLSCLIDRKNKQMVGGTDIQMRGFLFVKDSENVVTGLEKIFINVVKENLEKDEFDKDDCIDRVKDECTKFTRKTTLRSPVIEVIILEVDDFE